MLSTTLETSNDRCLRWGVGQKATDRIVVHGISKNNSHRVHPPRKLHWNFSIPEKKRGGPTIKKGYSGLFIYKLIGNVVEYMGKNESVNSFLQNAFQGK
ncbi:unnamed protein product [Dovyalis caffra]|uniref:Ribosomal protein S19 n=1 Tax=Dovyalis caffra TaxID=77055 RepID=A0AAV1SAY3_9ROSI|nr:unnamed protein product [Dovyalis caffra]